VAKKRVLGGKYRVHAAIAEGGMGSVWAGHHLSLDIPIAVKFMDARLLDEGKGDWAQRFEREAKSAAKLRHPQVVQIFDHGIEDGVPYIVMELLEGEDLALRMAKSGPMSLEAVAWIAQQVARPLGRAHELGIVHRDLKPGNLFVTRVGDEEMIKVLDFGIAKATLERPARECTHTGVVLGSPVYMSPEQAHDARDVDHRADLWALGVILFRALTSELPYRGSAAQVLLQICTGGPPSARAQRPDLPAAIDAFFATALARDPAQRFASAREMAAAFVKIAELSSASQPALGSVPGLELDLLVAPRDDGDATTAADVASRQGGGADGKRRSRALAWLGVGAGVVALAIVFGQQLEPEAEPAAPVVVTPAARTPPATPSRYPHDDVEAPPKASRSAPVEPSSRASAGEPVEPRPTGGSGRSRPGPAPAPARSVDEQWGF
jgi:serine/threonine-protein kinase